MKHIDAVVLGASGYVGGELLRLIHGHPEFRLAAAVSGSRSGDALGSVFPQLAAACPQESFASPDTWAAQIDPGHDVALFSAAPHGASADAVAAALDAASKRNLKVHVVDASADFRYADPQQYAAVYGGQHAQAQLLKQFSCAVPEHLHGTPTEHVGHPGCFATAMLLAVVPLAAAGLADDTVYITGVTGSTGSGRSPQEGTHHPERYGNLYAYKPLAHRHVPEVENLVQQATGRKLSVKFVPQSGPFARGIYVVVQGRLSASTHSDDLRAIYEKHYAGCEFVRIVAGIPRLKDVVASNYAHIGIALQDDSVVAMCAIDNLVKGAAGGAMQWMNRLWCLSENSGLLMAAPAWL